jgi:hypothetical protein
MKNPDPDPHQGDKSNPDPHQSGSSTLLCRLFSGLALRGANRELSFCSVHVVPAPVFLA